MQTLPALKLILMDKDVSGTQVDVTAAISDLLMHCMDISLLVITKVLVEHASALCGKTRIVACLQ